MTTVASGVRPTDAEAQPDAIRASVASARGSQKVIAIV
jgi:hypothetical protein